MPPARFRRYLPLITARVRFSPLQLPPPPIITPRVNFGTQVQRGLTPSSDGDLVDDDRNSYNDEAQEQNPVATPSKQIPKPIGEAGRPGSGGYNLEDTLHWPKPRFSNLQVSHVYFVHSVCSLLL